MPKWNVETRVVNLMNTVAWKNFEEWHTCIPNIVQSHIPGFMEWFYTNLAHIKEERVRDAMLMYYEQGETFPTKTGFNQALERGRIALTALYNKEEGKTYGRPEQHYFNQDE